MAGLTLSNISKSFEKRSVLNSVSFELAEGELLVLLGPSGCGKSTLLRIIAGLEIADEGEIYINSRRVDQLKPAVRDVALVFQNYSLYPHMTVAQNLGFPLKVAGMSKSESKERIKETANLLDLGDRLADRPSQLSGGQRQRVALGRAIIRKPSLFLLDEPLSNLDADLRVKMRHEIVRLQKELNRTMVHVTHDQTEALTMGDRVALLNDGILQQLGTPEELYLDPANRFVAEFLGQPKINMISGSVLDKKLRPFGINLPFENGPIIVGLRPELINIPGDGSYSATVIDCEYMGDHYEATLRLHGDSNSDEKTLCVSNLDRVLTHGDQIRFSFEHKELLYFDSKTGVRVRIK